MRGLATILRSIQIITAGYVSSQIKIHAATFVGPLVFVVTTFLYLYSAANFLTMNGKLYM